MAGLDLIGRVSPGSAGRNRTLAIERFEALEIPLPPFEEQRRVGKHLDHIEAAADELRGRTDDAAAVNDALIVSMAARPDLSVGEKRRAGWEHTPLRDVLHASTAQVTVDLAAEYRIAGIYSFGRGLIDRGPISGSDTSYITLTRLAAGDVVVSKLNGWEGAVAVVNDHFAGHHVSNEYPTFSPDRDRLLSEFFVGITRAPSFWEDLNTNARGSMVRRRRINPTEFLATRVWLPPIDEQERIAHVIARMSDVETARGMTAPRIDALLPAALNEAFAGLS